MVEGYASAGSRDEQFLQSRARAVSVRAYIVGKFHLDPRATGIMALGDDVVGSPLGNRWEGVALALFVNKDTLETATSSNGSASKKADTAAGRKAPGIATAKGTRQQLRR
jgi:hypothetical protein